MAPTRATHLDLMAWQWNTGIRLETWEARAVMRLGTAWVNAMADDGKTGKSP